jgi:hypothetical protein
MTSYHQGAELVGPLFQNARKAKTNATHEAPATPDS